MTRRRTWHFTRRAHRLAVALMLIAGVSFGLFWPYAVLTG